MRRVAMLEDIKPCQVPSAALPIFTGIAMEVWVRAARIWDGMSSGPSAVWR